MCRLQNWYYMLLAGSGLALTFGSSLEPSCTFTQPDQVLGVDHIAVLTVKSQGDCCDACVNNTVCVAFDFATGSVEEGRPGNCWLKDNSVRQLGKAHQVSGLVQRPSVALQAHVGRLVGTVLPQYASFDMDWWHNTSGSGGDWGNASVLFANLSSPRLRHLTSALYPAFWRIGGSQDKNVKYLVGAMSEMECKQPSAFRHDNVSLCLTMERWQEVLDFAAASGLELIFGTSFFTSKGPGADAPWDSRNVLDFLNYTASRGYKPYGLELGEEMQPESCAEDASSCPLVQAYRLLRGAVQELWPTNPPLIMGPCDGMSIETKTNPFMTAFLRQTLQEGLLDAVVMHSYNNDGGDNWQRPGFLKQTLVQAQDMMDMARNWSHSEPQLWCGECGPHNGGGVRNVTDRVMSSFWYLDALGGLARLGLKQHGRQALVGSHYGLLQDYTYEPNPDYFTLLLWKRLMGEGVLNVTVTASVEKDLHVYAHCSRDAGNSAGSVTIAFVNVSPDRSYTLDLTLSGSPSTSMLRREEYLLAAPRGDVLSKQVALNGKVLMMDGDELPPMPAVHRNGSKPLDVLPLTFGFVVLPDAQHSACGGGIFL